MPVTMASSPRTRRPIGRLMAFATRALAPQLADGRLDMVQMAVRDPVNSLPHVSAGYQPSCPSAFVRVDSAFGVFSARNLVRACLTQVFLT